MLSFISEKDRYYRCVHTKTYYRVLYVLRDTLGIEKLVVDNKNISYNIIVTNNVEQFGEVHHISKKAYDKQILKSIMFFKKLRKEH